jgi:competence protein ComEC
MASAIVVAWLYCVLAGWGIPARRTFFTLAVAGTASVMRAPLSTSRILVLAAAVVTALDPWAPIAPGFWLSFGAVAIVLAWTRGSSERPPEDAGRWGKFRHGLISAARLQCVVTAGLTPMLAFLTQQVALAAPFANAVAIPAVSFLVTPLALLCALCGAMFGAAGPARWAGCAGQWVFEQAMAWVAWLARQDWAVVDVAAPPMALLVLAVGGMAWALLPPAWPSRHWAWLLLLPALCWRPARPAPGEWRLVALDVGQGGAVVVETASHTLLFDTGPWHRSGTDGAQRVVWPYLRARGIRRIDTLVISHPDLDHAGGTDTLLRALPVNRAYTSFDLHAWLRRDFHMRRRSSHAPVPEQASRCHAGVGWQADGVRFDFVHPGADAKAPRRANEGGCVLLVQGPHHSALLPGDVGVAQERGFAAMLPHVDVLVAPHHGSSTSSSEQLVQATQSVHVIAQAGYLNRFRHPSPSVERRWRRAGATFWRTDTHGALLAHSRAQGLTFASQRDSARRYWHAR